MTKRVIVGLSGGVDSAVSAFLLKKQGYSVEGLFMKNWEEDDSTDYCSAAADLEDAQAVCEVLDIPLHRVNFAAEYWEGVFEHFLAEHRAGRTPNPDILCNKVIKFNAFAAHAKHLGADYIATGHYVRRQLKEQNWHLLCGLDANKDQSYFLYTLGQAQLAQALFPVGELTKPEVRQLAEQAKLPNFSKKDSTGICFIGEQPFQAFLQRFLPQQPGLITDEQGHTLGEHAGVIFYTLGQRKGLNIGGRQGSSGQPWYVIDKDLSNNRLIVAQGANHPRLFARHLLAHDLHWVNHPPSNNQRCQARVRYRQHAQPCTVLYSEAEKLSLQFDTQQRAITPGQSVVLYQGAECLGGGVITASE